VIDAKPKLSSVSQITEVAQKNPLRINLSGHHFDTAIFYHRDWQRLKQASSLQEPCSP